VSAGSSYVVAARAHAAEDLGGDDHVFARDIQILESLAERLLAFSFGVDIRGVEEVDAGIDGCFDQGVGARLVDVADGFPEAFAAMKGHGAEAEIRNEKAGVT
jgi:hypothetical protein